MFKDDLINEACELFDVHPRDLLGDYRFKFLMPPRFALAKAMRMRGWTYTRIGSTMGCDHTSIMYRVKEAEYRMAKDPAFAEKVRHLADLRLEASDE